MKKKSYSAVKLLQLQKMGFQIQAKNLRKQNCNRKKLDEVKHSMKSQQKQRKRILSHIQPKKKVGIFLQPTKIISVSAQKWAIYDFYTTKYIRGYRAHNKAQLGVFSKLLVFCTIHTLIKNHKLQPSKFQTIVTLSVLKMFPRQNMLKEDDIILLYDLLHMMILDESQLYEVVLGVNVGAYLYKKHCNQYYSVYDVNEKSPKDHLKYFYELVNSYCKLMSLQNVKYVESDPTLRKQMNHCSASDVAKLSIQCLNIPLYQSIIKKKQHYSTQIKYVDQKGHLSSKNLIVLNKCIQQKYNPYLNICRNWQQRQFLASHCSIRYESEKREQIRPVVVVLLQCYSPNDRQKDIQQIVEWYLKGQNLLNRQKSSQQINSKILKTLPAQKLGDVLQRKIQQKLSLNRNIKHNISFPKLQNSQTKKKVRRVFNLKTQQSV